MNFRVIKDCVVLGKEYVSGDEIDIDMKMASSLLGKYLSGDILPSENRSIGLDASPEIIIKRKKKTVSNGS